MTKIYLQIAELMNKKLAEAETMKEILDIVQEEYNLNEKLGIATKLVVIKGIDHVIKIIRAKKKHG